MTNRRTCSTLGALIGLGMVLGCSSEPDNIGDGEVEVDKSLLASYAASWDGYVEAHSFKSGSDRVRIVLDASGNGFVQVGEGALLPPPTEAMAPYPSVVTASDPFPAESLYDGIAYQARSARVESERIRFDFDPHGAFTEWCALQESLPIFNGTPAGYSCLPASGWSGPDENGSCTTAFEPDGEQVTVDCSWINICIYACECNETACSARPGTEHVVDAALDDAGEELEGTMLIDGSPYTIRLTRE